MALYDDYDDQVDSLIRDGWGYYGTYQLDIDYTVSNIWEREVYYKDDAFIAFDVEYNYHMELSDYTPTFEVEPITTTSFERKY